MKCCKKQLNHLRKIQNREKNDRLIVWISNVVFAKQNYFLLQRYDSIDVVLLNDKRLCSSHKHPQANGARIR
jgi:hypothetical protein